MEDFDFICGEEGLQAVFAPAGAVGGGLLCAGQVPADDEGECADDEEGEHAPGHEYDAGDAPEEVQAGVVCGGGGRQHGGGGGASVVHVAHEVGVVSAGDDAHEVVVGVGGVVAAVGAFAEEVELVGAQLAVEPAEACFHAVGVAQVAEGALVIAIGEGVAAEDGGEEALLGFFAAEADDVLVPVFAEEGGAGGGGVEHVDVCRAGEVLHLGEPLGAGFEKAGEYADAEQGDEGEGDAAHDHEEDAERLGKVVQGAVHGAGVGVLFVLRFVLAHFFLYAGEEYAFERAARRGDGDVGRAGEGAYLLQQLGGGAVQ